MALTHRILIKYTELVKIIVDIRYKWIIFDCIVYGGNMGKVKDYNFLPINWVSQDKAVRIVNRSRQTLYKWRKNGRVKCRKVNGRLYYEVNTLIEEAMKIKRGRRPSEEDSRE